MRHMVDFQLQFVRSLLQLLIQNLLSLGLLEDQIFEQFLGQSGYMLIVR